MGEDVSKLKSVIPYVLLVATGLLIVCTVNTGQDWGGDFSSYIMQAESLVEGSPNKFVEANQFSIERSTHHIAPVAYPWGYPAMLAPVYAGYGQNILALKSVGAVCFLLFLLVLLAGFRKRHSGVWRWCLVGLFALNPTLLVYLNRILSDIPFLLFSTLCVVLIGKFAVERRRFITPGIDGILLGVLIATACTIRSNGVVLMATLVVTQAVVFLTQFRRRRVSDDFMSPPAKDLNSTESSIRHSLWVSALPYVSFFVVTLTCRVLLPSGESGQLEVLKDISLGTLWYNLFYYGNMPADFYGGVPLPYLVYLASLPLVIVGVFRRRRSDHHMAVFIVLTFSLYVVYPPLAGFRFLFPIMPFYISFMLSGLEAMQGGSSGGRFALRRVLCILPIAFIIICFSVLSISNARENLNRNRATLEGPYTDSSSDMFEFIKQETEPDSTLVFFKPRVLRMMTGRRSFTTLNAEQIWHGDYLVMYLRDEGKPISLEDAAHFEAQGASERIFMNDDFSVYRLIGLREPMPASD
jgi:hypothetical protein